MLATSPAELATLALAGDPPVWLAGARRAALAQFAAAGLPTPALEDWKYTDVSPLARRALVPATRADAERPGPDELVGNVWGGTRLVVIDGHLRADLSDVERLPAGVRVSALAAHEAATTIRFDASHGGFAALNLALFGDGLLIDVAADCPNDALLNLVFMSTAGDGLLRTPRLHIRLAPHARVRIAEEYVGVGGGLTNTVCECMIGAGAELIHYRVQNEAATASHIGQLMVEVGRDATYRADVLAFGAALSRVGIDIALVAPGARCALQGLFMATGDQHFDHHTRIDHAVGNTHSEERFRGILDERSRGVFNGKVVVARDAQGISARQTSNNLLLSRGAEIDTKPELEIYADDVQCSHGATVGELDRDALFYLRSRGIEQAQARAILTYAFAQEIIAGIPLAALRDWVEQHLLGARELADLARAMRTSLA
jgi:Fe-S cluster assembly protein SufD